MNKKIWSTFNEDLDEVLRRNPVAAKEYARLFAKLPLPTQLAIMRRQRWLSQEAVAKTSRVKQPHVARMERRDHDPRASSLQAQARALRCHVVVVPDESIGMMPMMVRDKLGRVPKAKRKAR